MARSGRRAAAVAANQNRARETTVPAVKPDQPAPPAFHERSLFNEGLAAAFRIEVGGGSATGSLPHGAGENEIAKFLSEAVGLTKQMQTVMGGSASGGSEGPVLQILVADSQAGPSRQSGAKVSVDASGGTVVTMQPGGGGHLIAMLQHFLMVLSPAPRNAA